MTYPTTSPDSLHAPVSDPLAGLPRPQGNPGTVQSAGQSYQAAGQELDSLSRRLTQSANGTVGQAWIGRAGASCQQSVGGLSNAYQEAAQDAQDAAGALLECAQKWRGALDDYDRARRLADQAVEEETAHRERAEREAQEASASGDEGRASVVRSSAATYQSQGRMQAQRMASAAIHDFDAATQAACGKLDSVGASVKSWMTALSVTGGGALGALQKIYEYGSTRWVRHIPGYVTSKGEYIPPKGYVPDNRMRSKWARHAKGLKLAGNTVAFATAGVSQWAADQRKHPDMETDERVGRAVAQGATVGVGGAAAGAALGSAVGSVVPVAGTAVGFVVGGVAGYFIGEGIDSINDGAVDAVGNAFDAAGDWVSDTWDDVTPW